MLLCLCPVGCLSLAFLNWDSQQGRDLATSGCNIKKIQLGQSYSYIMRKVWYHQIWIQNNLGFMVSDLFFIAYLVTISKALIKVRVNGHLENPFSQPCHGGPATYNSAKDIS